VVEGDGGKVSLNRESHRSKGAAGTDPGAALSDSGTRSRTLTSGNPRKTFVVVPTLLSSASRAPPLPHTQTAGNGLTMMAHDSTSDPGALGAETIDAVRSALTQYVAAPDDSEPLRRALHTMAAEAHEKSIMAEQLLVVLKDVWYSVPVVGPARDPVEQVRLLQRVVTICIKEYYGD
jgi:hypothetical protein